MVSPPFLLEKFTTEDVWSLSCRYKMDELKGAALHYVKSNFFLMHRTSLEGLPARSFAVLLLQLCIRTAV